MNAEDDIVAAFGLDAAPVRGRCARLASAALDPILRRHDYPRPVAMLLGEALTLAALLGSLLKSDGRLIVQAQGGGPVSLLVAEHNGGALRGYARIDAEARRTLANVNRLSPSALLGAGALAITLDQGDDAPSYQGVVELNGETLAACAEAYFRTSEQTDTRIRLAAGEAIEHGDPAIWRSGGVLMQRVAGDNARGDTREDWSRATILFDTITDAELIDPALPAHRLLYRLFHEEGVRMGAPSPLLDRCTCDSERLTAVMRQFPPEELRELVEPDGLLHARCQFCSRGYEIDPAEVGAG